jgi:hypothetical protein
MPPEYGERLSGLRQQVRSAVFDLKLGGVLDSVANYACLRSEEKPSLRAVASCGNIRILEELLAEAADQDEKNEALISAVINNQLTAVEMLIAAGADVNAKDNLFGRTAIMYVTKRTRKEIVRLLGAAGADASQNSA